MRAKFINEKFYTDEESDPVHDMGIGDPTMIEAGYLQRYAETNNYEFSMNKKGTPAVSIPVHFWDFESYAFRSSWPVLFTKIQYTITYVEGWDTPFSVRKQWWGYDSSKVIDDIILKLDPKFPKYQSLPREALINEFKKILKKDPNYPVTFIKQNLMGRYLKPNDALQRINLNLQRELKNQKKRV